jgi:integrase
MALTDVQLRTAKPTNKPYRLADGGGLYIEIALSGSKLWRVKYRFLGVEKLLSLGVYPTVTLADARKGREDAKRLLANNLDPAEVKRAEKQRRQMAAANSFEVVAREWLTSDYFAKLVKSTKTKKTRQLEQYVFPYIGKRVIAELTAPDVLEVLLRIQKLGFPEVAHKTKNSIGQVFRYAAQKGLATYDPTPTLKGALTRPKAIHFASPAGDIDAPKKVGDYLRMFDSFKGSPTVAAAMRILPLLFCRVGELRAMKWDQIDFEAAEWRYIATKTKTPHIVPLTKQAVEILRDLYPLTGRDLGGYVFTGERTTLRPISDAAINAAYQRLGINTQTELTGHGWRSIARTLLHERLGYAPDIIERQLAHAVHDANGTAYNRTQFLDERKKMMQEWADYLDKMKQGAEIIEFKAA